MEQNNVRYLDAKSAHSPRISAAQAIPASPKERGETAGNRLSKNGTTNFRRSGNPVFRGKKPC